MLSLVLKESIEYSVHSNRENEISRHTNLDISWNYSLFFANIGISFTSRYLKYAVRNTIKLKKDKAI